MDWRASSRLHPWPLRMPTHTYSRPWLCYWMLHSLDLLQGVQPKAGNEELLRGVIGTYTVASDGGWSS